MGEKKKPLFGKRDRQKRPWLFDLPNAQPLIWYGFCCCILFCFALLVLELISCSDVVETVLVIAPTSCLLRGGKNNIRAIYEFPLW